MGKIKSENKMVQKNPSKNTHIYSNDGNFKILSGIGLVCQNR